MVWQGNAQLDCALNHAMTCKALQLYDLDLWKDALESSGQSALSAKLVDKPTSVQEDSAEVPDNSQPKKLRSQTSLNVDQLWDVGKNNKDKQLKLYQARVDHVIMWLICVCGLVPNIIDLPKWRELMHLVNRPTILHQLIFLLINIFHTRPSMFVANKSRICIVSKTSC